MPESCLIVPYAQAAGGVNVLVVRAALVQTRVGGKPAIRIPGQAGQWVLAGGRLRGSQSAVAGALALFDARTGIDVTVPSVARGYGLSAPAPTTLQDARYNSFTAVYVAATPAGLEALAADINRNLAAQTIADGAYVEAAAVRLAEAMARFKPVPEPQGGWPEFIKRAAYGGREPGGFDAAFPTLVGQITRRSAKASDHPKLALAALPGQDVRPVPGRLVRLQVDNAQPVPNAADTYVATYDAGGSATVRAVTEPPEAAAGVTWQGGATTGERYAAPLARTTKADEAPMTVTAALGEAQLSVKLFVIPKLSLTASVAI